MLGLSVTALKGGARLTVRCSASVRATVAKAGSTLSLSIPGSRLGRFPRLLRPGRGGVVAVRALGYGRGRAAGARFRVVLQPRCTARLTRSGRRGTVTLEVQPPAVVATTAPRRSAVALRDGEPLRHVREFADADDRPSGTAARITAIRISGDEEGTDVEITGRGTARPKIQRLLGRRSRVVLSLASARLAIAGVPAPPLDSMLRRIRAAQVTDQPAACRIVLDLKPGRIGGNRGNAWLPQQRHAPMPPHSQPENAARHCRAAEAGTGHRD